jgi:uncharacterized SAM-binding protein YcdF (DUF218 family)
MRLTGRLSTSLTCALVGVGVGIALPVVGGILPVASWLAAPLIVADETRRVDAIVVLGAGTYDETTLTPASAYRLLRGLQLLKAGQAPLMILSGGGHRGTRISDAKAMAQVAATLGADFRSLVVDETSSATWRQAESVAWIATSRGMRSIALVTSPLHSYRAAMTFRRAGLEVVGVPAGRHFDPRLLTIAENQVAGRLNAVIQALYEYTAIAAYRFHGRL